MFLSFVAFIIIIIKKIIFAALSLMPVPSHLTITSSNLRPCLPFFLRTRQCLAQCQAQKDFIPFVEKMKEEDRSWPYLRRKRCQIVSRVYTYPQIHPAVYTKYVQLFTCQSYLNIKLCFHLKRILLPFLTTKTNIKTSIKKAPNKGTSENRTTVMTSMYF